MIDKLLLFFILLLEIQVTFASNDEQLQKRKPFDIPLPHMTYLTDSVTSSFEIFVAFNESREGWGISTGSDRYVKDTRKVRMDHTYRELPSQVTFISNFEAGVLAEVCGRFAETLLMLERDLKSKHWDKCLFMDAYLPNFLKRFHYLICAAQSSLDALPKVTRINDTLFECSENSLQSDRRIELWQSDSGHCVKLRIAAKEFAYQLNKWKKDVLLNPERDLWDNKTDDLFSVYELFIRLYFNLPQKKLQ
ncbi:MAG TPA: hypothetical protein VHO70_04015 [Chitinispirillaceae bacterium]|nr:hypothetical protein [Chitinispirillaceae bacterium]